MTILDELAAYALERIAADQAVISLEEMQELLENHNGIVYEE